MTRALLLVFLALMACSNGAGAPSPADAAADMAADVVVDVTNDVTVADRVVAPDVAAESSVTDAAADVALDGARDGAAVDGADASVDGPSVDDILGTLRATCGTIPAMLRSPAPSLVRDDLTFMPPERYVREALSPDGQRLYDTANAGGSSTESEVMSFEVLHYCDGASLLATETEIHYAPPDDSGANSITDILVRIAGERVGVSVTRMYRPAPMVITDADVRDLLVRKLQGVNRSSMRVLPEDRWVKQILHVFAASPEVADQVARVWATLDAPTRADTIVLVTATRGGGFIYCNPDPPLGMECPSL